MDATDNGVPVTQYYGCWVVDFYNEHRTHTRQAGRPPAPSLDTADARASLRAYRWQPHCRGLYHTPRAA